MGNLADVLVVKLRSEFGDATLSQQLRHIPEDYQTIFQVLWEHFGNLEAMMDSKNANRIEVILSQHEAIQAKYWDQYRGPCLQQILRSQFFETLFIAEDTYSTLKRNLVYVLSDDDVLRIQAMAAKCKHTVNATPKWSMNCNGRDIITEEQWATTKPEDQQFVEKASDDLEANGFNVHRCDKE